MEEPLSPEEISELAEYNQRQKEFEEGIGESNLSDQEILHLADVLLNLQSSEIQGALVIEKWSETQRNNCLKIIEFLLNHAKNEYLDKKIMFPTTLSQKEPLIYTPRKRLEAIQKQLIPRDRR